MIRQNKGKSIEEFVESLNAPLEHMFDNHKYCQAKWYNNLKSQAEGLPYNHPEKLCSRANHEGEKMYQDFRAITKKYGSDFLTPNYAPIYHPDE